MDDTKYSIGIRLQDPHGILSDNPELLQELNKKISSCLTRLFRAPVNGGNPFVFSFTSGRIHEVRDTIGGDKFTTAATDGNKYFWSPDFLKKLLPDEVGTVMEHEAYHTIFFHPSRGKAFSNKKVWNWAVDYTGNAIIETEVEKNNRKITLWGGNLGKPLPLTELLEWIDGKIEFDESSRVFADKSLYGRSPDSIYEEIMEHIEKSPRKCPTCGALSLDPKTGKSKNNGPPEKGCCPDCGAKCDGSGDYGPDTMDSHIPSSIDKQEILGDVMRAKQTSSSMRGYTPSSVEELLEELHHPVLKFTDLILSACMRKTQETGLHNNWKRLRRKYLPGTRPAAGGYKGQYLPTRHTHKARWLAFVDTSGSMSGSDLIYAVSQLQCLGNTEGVVCPMDASVKWKDATSIKKADKTNLQKVKITGRGGTDFTEAFKNYKKELGNEWDCIIILTDGDCGTYPIELKPSCDVVWVLTRDQKNWSQPFGRVVPLRTERM